MRVLLIGVVTVLLSGFVTDAFAQGGTSVRFRAVSRGGDDGGNGCAEFWKDGVRFYRECGGAGRGRGFNVAVINRNTADLLQPVAHFDTWRTRLTGEQMLAFVDYLINQVPVGALVLVAECDEAGLTYWGDQSCVPLPYVWVTQAYQALEALGSASIRSYCYSDTWAFATVKGEGQTLGERLGGRGEVVSIETTIVLPVEPTTWGQIKAVYQSN